MRHLLLFSLLLICPYISAQKTNPIQEAIANYDYKTALMLINKEKPTSALLFQKGKVLKEIGRYYEALQTFEEILKTDPENVRSIIEAAECCKLLSLNNKAIKYYSIARVLLPDNQAISLQQANLLYQTEKFKEAIAICDEQIKTDSSAIMLRLKAECMKECNRKPEAIEIYQEIIKKYPTDFMAVSGLASLYIDTEQYDYAIQCTEQYRQIDTTNVAVNKKNAQAYCLAQMYEKAIQRYEVLRAYGDSTVATNYYLGSSYFATEKFGKARECFLVVLPYNQKNAHLHIQLATANNRVHRADDGLKFINKAFELTVPTDSAISKLYMVLAESYKVKSMYKEQINAMKEAYKYGDKKRQHIIAINYQIAIVYQYGLDDTAMARKYLEEFLSTRPKTSKSKQPELKNGEITIGLDNYYNAAESWLNEIKTGGTQNQQHTQE